ncbi:PBS lyase HEAT domain protein repeat-containing protein [Desulfarculus baarsii DSM 2075]|uniref:PBS lyase HEAT domain protein repeat-containing protein n=1 Tax=Desulfarculus baarsii (strain ATCC 33931 / DSM 2075 / LMG 7858 / VKM B-1802 / 2st14) TaxID=644282 RepID=E1QIR5_DESB2|nr:HEAT repeat domain-containing protein [Desulfarculus baarsii]ADK84488.1 PBS lyase HEAT domain protein repeat-containing protein [Desulfarculus baarsii DSM 2075]
MADNLEKIVLDALDAEEPNILRAACLLSGSMGLKEAERGLIKALGHKAWQIQAEAAKSLGLLLLPGALPFLRRLLKASDADLRQKVLAAAAGAKEPPSEAGDETHPEVRKAAAVAISRIQPGVAQEALRAALASGQANLMGAAMSGLANLEVTDIAQNVIELTANEDVAVRRAAAACLGRLREIKAVPRLVQLLQDSDAGVRKEAVIALNHIKSRDALAPLAACLDDNDAEVRRVTAIALGNTRLRLNEIVQPLIHALRDRDASVRQAALMALSNIKAPEALEAAASLLADTHDEVRKQAGATTVVLAFAKERPEYDPGHI